MFYDRFLAACNVRKIAPTTAIRNVNLSSGMKKSWQEGARPRTDIVAKLARYLNVSTDYLLEVSDDMTQGKANSLDSTESLLINQLRTADPLLKEAALRAVAAILSPDNSNGNVFSSTNDGISNHEEEEKFVKARKFHKRVEGEAAAGMPITAVPEDDLYIPVPEKYLNERYFIVRARSESMADRIPNGAFCVFLRDAPVDDGSTVLVQIDGQTDQPDGAIKRFYRMGKEVELRSDNPAFPPMRYPAESVRVTGVLAAVIPHKGDV